MKLRLLVPVFLLAAAAAAAPATAQMATTPSGSTGRVTWEIDRAHSELSFRIRHLVSRVRGTFDEWSGTVEADPANFANGSVNVRIRTASINTNHQRRDNHLRSPDFFDAERNPEIVFQSTRVEGSGESFRVHGNLTMNGVTRPVVLDTRYVGTTRDGQGRQRLGFEAETRVNRGDFNITWNNVAEGGGVVLGDEVTITITIAAVRS